ncbi:MAG: phosphatidylglycerophosphatase A [Elusimicrobia bacterium]|nr:phosphatidylglycerophosphatase A [Elusimicrobiota bacterium]
MLDRLCVVLATGLGISYIALPAVAGRKWTGSGFMGSVEGILLWFLLPASPGAFWAVVAAVSLAAFWICGRADKALGTHDNPRIVLDEVVGVWIAAAGLPREAKPALLAFVLFRIFDSVKLPPYRWLERLPGGIGVVADDLGAGLVASLAARWILGRWGWA